jgi:hypothetical protein
MEARAAAHMQQQQPLRSRISNDEAAAMGGKRHTAAVLCPRKLSILLPLCARAEWQFAARPRLLR